MTKMVQKCLIFKIVCCMIPVPEVQIKRSCSLADQTAGFCAKTLYALCILVGQDQILEPKDVFNLPTSFARIPGFVHSLVPIKDMEKQI